jgi:branched-chain amino acid transport system substrate-binding protein
MKMIGFHRARVRGSVGLVCAALLVATLAACGGTDKALTKSTATGSPVKIGVVASLSGQPLPALAGPAALKAWATTVNGKGGLQGHPVEIVVKDDGNDPAKGLTAVKELVEKDGVVAITSWSGVDMSWADYAQKAHIPIVGGQSYSPPWMSNPVFFPVQSTLGTALTSQPLMAKAAGAKSIGSFYTADVAAAVQAVKAIQGIAGQLGLTAKYGAAISSSQPSFVAPCLAAKKAGVEAIMLTGVPVEKITQACFQQGFKPKWILPGEQVTANVLSTPNLGEVLAPQMAFPFFLDDPATKAYRSAMDTDYRGPVADKFSPLTAGAWMAGLVYQQVFDNIGTKKTVSVDDVFSGLYKVNDLTSGGLISGVTYSQNQKQRGVNCFWQTKVEGGKWVAPDGLKTTCLPSA